MNGNGTGTHIGGGFARGTLLAFALAGSGCDDGSDDGGNLATNGSTEDTAAPVGPATGDVNYDCETAPTHAQLQQIWDVNCVTECHEPNGTWSSMDLSPDVAYDNLVDFDGVQTTALSDVKVVVAGDLDNSYLIHKLRGTQESVAGAVAGAQMPLERSPLSEEEIASIEAWVFCGAEP